MRFALPSTRTFGFVCGGVVAAIVAFMVIGGALEAVLGPRHPAGAETVVKIVFFAVVLVGFLAVWALMIRSILAFQLAFWRRFARNRETADTVARVAAPARRIADVVIVVGWAVVACGLAIALPAMIADGFFS